MFGSLAMVLTVFSAPSVEQDWKNGLPASYHACIRKAEKRFPNDEMRRTAAGESCAERELRRRERLLDATYHSVRKSLSPLRRKHLVELQGVWFNATNDLCWGQAAHETSDTFLVALYLCKRYEINQRIAWLLSSDVGGALDAPR